MLFRCSSERSLNVIESFHLQILQCDPKLAGGFFRAFHGLHVARNGGIAEHGNAGQARYCFFEQFKALGAYLG